MLPDSSEDSEASPEHLGLRSGPSFAGRIYFRAQSCIVSASGKNQVQGRGRGTWENGSLREERSRGAGGRTAGPPLQEALPSMSDLDTALFRAVQGLGRRVGALTDAQSPLRFPAGSLWELVPGWMHSLQSL